MKHPFLVAAVLFTLTGTATADGKLVVYNWAEYIPEGVLDDFEKETGIDVEYSTYENNETMYAKLKIQKGKGYDVVVPSTYLVSKMRDEGLLQKIDNTKISNFKNLMPDLLNKSYDPKNEYSVPYLWGSTGIGVNTENIDASTITSWNNLWDEKWKNKLMLVDDVREVFGMALQKHDYSVNTRNPDEIKIAYEDLQKLMPNVRVFNADAPREPYLAGDVDLGMQWSGEASMAQKENDKIQYIYPKEGAGFWIDSFTIPSGAENVENAHKFIDYMLRPEVGKKVVEELGYSTPNLAAKTIIDEKLRNNPIIFPPDEVMAKAEFQQDVGDAIKLYDSYWEKLKTGK